MPVLRKIKAPVPKVKGKRGRPKGAVAKSKWHIFEASDGCQIKTGMRNASGHCQHGYAFAYKRTVEE